MRIRFTRHDLLSLNPPGTGYSMVVCKNVLLHFTAPMRVSVLDMFHSALAENASIYRKKAGVMAIAA
jgi:chemotaxis protein methyltransferase CheR